MIDPRISMGATVPNLQTSMQLFQNTLNNIQNRKANAQVMAQDEQMNPLRLREAEQAVEANQLGLDANRQNEIIRSVAEFAPTLKPLLENGDYVGSLQALQVRKQDLQSRGVDTTETDDAIQEIMNGNPDNVLQSLNVAESEAANRGLIGGVKDMTAAQRERKSLLDDLKSPDENIRKSAEVALRIAAPASSSAQERIAGDKNLGDAVANQKAAEEAAKETARLSAQLKLQPEVDAAVKSAVLLAQNEADRVESDRSSKRALDVYNVGMKGLTSAMGDAYTGSFAGLMPAITQKARVADGAVAAMAPILKAMFRSSGEGTFTDKDQEMLVAMIPTRRDDDETRAAKLKNIDAIVRTKLGSSDPAPSEQSKPGDNDVNLILENDEEYQRLLKLKAELEGGS